MKFDRDVAPGIHRVEDAYVNWYIVEEGDQLCIVDAGHPGSWDSLHDALAMLGRTPTDISALILTHGHFDHVGFARRAHEELGIPVFVHELDQQLASHPWDYEHERSRLAYAARHPSFDLAFAAMGLKGALTVDGIYDTHTFTDGDVLDVPGNPRVLHLPGHTAGEVAFCYPERSVVIAGDSIVTHDPYTGATGPRIVAGAATADSQQALASLGRLSLCPELTLLPGHGEPWQGPIAAAVAEAVRVGAT